MSFYQIDSNNLRSGKDELISLNERFRQEKENLESCEQNLGGMWEGEANEHFHNTFVKNASQLEIFYNLINRYCEALEVIAARYELAENKNLSVAGKRAY